MAFLREELIAVRLSVLYAKGELGQMQIILEEQPDAPSMTTAHQRTLVAEAKGATDLALRLAPSLNIAGGIPLGEYHREQLDCLECKKEKARVFFRRPGLFL